MNIEEIIIAQVLHSWNSQIATLNRLLTGLSDQVLMHEVAPKRNRGIYLLGHLTAIHDLMLPLLRLEEAKFPELHQPFLESPDETVDNLPSIEQLKRYWKVVNETLSGHFINLSPEEWLSRHGNISEEDFVKEPQRNRLSVLLNRTNHLSYHLGQLAFLSKTN